MDVAILIAVVVACGFLLFPYVEFARLVDRSRRRGRERLRGGGSRDPADLRVHRAEPVLRRCRLLAAPDVLDQEMREHEVQGPEESGRIRYPAGDGGVREERSVFPHERRLQEGHIRIASGSPP